jgi:hypothetical protein
LCEAGIACATDGGGDASFNEAATLNHGELLKKSMNEIISNQTNFG